MSSTVPSQQRSVPAGPPPPSGYNGGLLPRNETDIMEAEHLNSISNKLDDIAQRAAELRRYL